MKESIRRRFAILKWIPRILMLGVVGFSAYVYFNYGRTEQESNQAKKAPSPLPKVVGQTSNISYSHYDEGVLVYHVNAEKTIQKKSNAQELENPEFIFYNKEEKETMRVRGKRCFISRNLNVITVSGNTVVTSPTGMSVSSDKIKYESRTEEFTSEEPSQFRWQTMKGWAKGFIYQIETQMLILPENPEIRYVNRAGDNKRPIVMIGDKGTIDRLNGYGFFEGNVVVTQGPDRIKADRIEVYFEPEGNTVRKITALNNVHVKFAKPDQQKAKAVSVDPAQNASPAGSQAPSMANVFTTEESSGKELEAELVELNFYDDGSTIRSFHSEVNCTFILHTYDRRNKPVENRIIKGETFDAQFNMNNEMEQFHANENVSVKLQPIGNPRKEKEAASQTIFCKDLIAYFASETGDVKEIHFNDGFRHEQNKRIVSSERAVYSGKFRKTDLIGNPEIQDPTFNITANSMELFEENSGIRAKGQVKSTFIRSEGNTPTTFPFSSPSGQPVYISAENMDWDAQKAEAVYTQKSKLWQEKNVITAEKIVINDKDKTLSAYDKVHTIFYNKKDEKKDSKDVKENPKGQAQTQPAQAPQTQPQQSEPQNMNIFALEDTAKEGPVSVDAGIMNYAEKDRIIHFEKAVKIVTPSTKIESQKADFFLKEKTSELERLYAQDKVLITHEKKRGVGDEAMFYYEEKKLVLEGGPRLSEAGKADILGRVLTLFLSDGRILIDGEEDGRANTTLQMDEGSNISLTSPSKSSNKNVPDAGLKNQEPN